MLPSRINTECDIIYTPYFKPNYNSHREGCGKRTCSVSTGIDGYLTFGNGELDDYGFWQYPCIKCEIAFYSWRFLELHTVSEPY